MDHFLFEPPLPGARLLAGALVVACALLGGARAEAQSYGWVQGTRYDALQAGIDTDGKPLYICMSDDPGGPRGHIGKRQAGWNYCAFGYNGVERTANTYKSLAPTWTRDLAGMTLGREANGTVQSFCHGWHEGGLHVGKQIGSDQACSIGYDGDEVWLGEYAVLQQVGTFSPWATSNVKPFPKAALIGGNEQDGKPLYLCRAKHAGGEHLGKTRSDWSDCAIGYGGDEVRVKNYEVFVPEFRQGTTETVRYPLLLAGGDSGGPFGVCLGFFGESSHPGKYVFSDKQCHFSYGGTERKTSSFSTLRMLP